METLTAIEGGDPAAGAASADVVLDTTGLFCPVPIIRTAERLGRMRAGEVLEVLSDDRVILIDMPAWCRATGHEYLGSREAEGAIRLRVRKTAGRAGPAGRGGGR
jgi:TusA-related sulfurtransferase